MCSTAALCSDFLLWLWPVISAFALVRSYNKNSIYIYTSMRLHFWAGFFYNLFWQRNRSVDIPVAWVSLLAGGVLPAAQEARRGAQAEGNNLNVGDKECLFSIILNVGVGIPCYVIDLPVLVPLELERKEGGAHLEEGEIGSPRHQQ